VMADFVPIAGIQKHPGTGHTDRALERWQDLRCRYRLQSKIARPSGSCERRHLASLRTAGTESCSPRTLRGTISLDITVHIARSRHSRNFIRSISGSGIDCSGAIPVFFAIQRKPAHKQRLPEKGIFSRTSNNTANGGRKTLEPELPAWVSKMEHSCNCRGCVAYAGL
jgi:hypothetical protein